MISDFNLNQLRTFYFVAKYDSTKIAASKLMVTVPAISIQLKIFQENYGLPLFKKRNHKLTLTEAGQRLYSVTEKIFDLVEQAEKIMVSAKGFPVGTLTLGINKTFFNTFFIPCFSSFQCNFPNIHIAIKEGASSEMVQSVLTGHNELAIVGRVRYPDKLESVLLIERPLFLIVPPGHNLCKMNQVSIDEIKDEQFIMKETGSGSRLLFENVCKEKNIFPKIIIETGNDQGLGNFVKEGKGISILLKEAFYEDLRKGRLIAIPFHKDDEMIVKVDIVFRKGKPLSNAADSFLRFVSKEINGIKLPTDFL